MIITKTIEWDMGHRIPNHKSKCKNPHGHRYKLEVYLKGDLIEKNGKSDEGMVMDFSDIKIILSEEVKRICDHAFMIYKKDKKMLDFFNKNDDFKYIVVPFIPTAECIAKWIYEKLEKRFVDKYKTGLILDSVRLWETPTSAAIYKKTNYSS